MSDDNLASEDDDGSGDSPPESVGGFDTGWEFVPLSDPVLPVDTPMGSAQTAETQLRAMSDESDIFSVGLPLINSVPLLPPPPAPVFRDPMEPDQRAAYNAWLSAGGVGSPPDWVLVNRADQRRQQADAAAALAQLATLPGAIQAMFDTGGTGYGSAYSIASGLTPTLPEPGVTFSGSTPPLVSSTTGAPPALTTSAAAQAYADLHPDLANNWQNSFKPENANDPTAQFIRAFETFEAYIENDHGGPFVFVPGAVPPPPAVNANPSAMPPLTTTSAAAAAYAQLHPDLANNWQNAFAPQNANDGTAIWIRQFPTFEAYIENDHGGSFAGAAGAPGAVLPPPRVTPGGVTIPGTGVSPLFDPVHRLAGYTREGYEVYRQVDEGGRIVEYYDIPGQGATGVHYLNSANDPASYVYSSTRPGGGGGVVRGGGGGGNANNNGNSKTILIVGGIALAAYVLMNRRER